MYRIAICRSLRPCIRFNLRNQRCRVASLEGVILIGVTVDNVDGLRTDDMDAFHKGEVDDQGAKPNEVVRHGVCSVLWWAILDSNQ